MKRHLSNAATMCAICRSNVSSYELEIVDEVLSELTELPSMQSDAWRVINELQKRGGKDEDSVCSRCAMSAMHDVICRNMQRIID